MSDPALEFFRKLEVQSDKRKVAPDERTFPGSTPPRNSGHVVDSGSELWLNRLPSREYSVNGETRRFYTIGSIAKALGKKQVTIRSWEAKGWLPPTMYRTPPPKTPQVPGKQVKGQRLYTKDQLLFLVMAYNEYIEEADRPNWDAFRKAIKRQYPKQ